MLTIENQLRLGTEKVALRVMNCCEPDQGISSILIDVVYVADSACKYNDSIGFYTNHPSEKNHFKGVTIVSYMDSYQEAPLSYGLVVRDYMCEELSLSKASEIVNTLAPIEKRLSEIAVERGNPAGFLDYSMRFAEIVGASAYYCRNFSISQYERHAFKTFANYLESLVAHNVKALTKNLTEH